MHATSGRLGRPASKVMIAGLTAVGKTTHSHILARQFGFGVISATDVLLNAAQAEDLLGHPWFDHLAEIERRRDECPDIDDLVDRRLVHLAETTAGAVFDTWALPWLTDTPAYRIQLTSTDDAAARKVYVSQGLKRRHDLDGCLAHLREKNQLSQSRFLARHGVDLTKDDAFDVVIDNSALIADPSFASARRGILALKPVLHAITSCALAPTTAGLKRVEQILCGDGAALITRMRSPLQYP